ncbi:MAG: cyclic nucleotide-binding domain-containing protein [Rhodospirillales bacterium]|nr:cyclic nucleotide-binding domain-containing protein [Rhodospirillales bacterium]
MVAVEKLKSTDLFQDLSDQALEAIVGFAAPANFEEGDSIYQLGDDANDLFFLESGRIRFSIGVGNRPDGSGSLILPGKIFGWAALLHEQPRRVATASCLEDSIVHVIPRDKLLELFDKDHEAGYQVMGRLATTIAGDFVSVLSV